MTGTAPSGRDLTVVLPCGNRRHERCPKCSALYAGDAAAVMYAGMNETTVTRPVMVRDAAGKLVPLHDLNVETGELVPATEEVRWPGVEDPSVVCLFATWTAPSFGPVHFWDHHNNRPCRCGKRHASTDTDILGAPLNPARYNYAGQVAWCLAAPALRAAAVLAIRKAVPGYDVHYATVVEPHKRLVPHYHQVLLLHRKDGKPVAPHLHRVLANLVLGVVAGVDVKGRRLPEVVPVSAWVTVPGIDDAPVRQQVRFGTQAEVRPVPLGEEGRVVRYLVKYLTKDLRDRGPKPAPSSVPAGRHRDRLTEEARRIVGWKALREDPPVWPLAPLPAVTTLRPQSRRGRIRTRKALRAIQPHPLPLPFGGHATLDELLRDNRGHKRAIEAGGYRGMVVTKSRGWPLTMAACRERRREHKSESEEQARLTIVWHGNPVRLFSEAGWRRYPELATLHHVLLTGDPTLLNLPPP